MDGAADPLCTALIQRSGEVSKAGRMTFLAAAADATIDCIAKNLSPTKAS